jgi:pilus assembly protein FimV
MPSTRMIEPEPTEMPRSTEVEPLDFDFGLPAATGGGKPRLPELPDLNLPSPSPKAEVAEAVARSAAAGAAQRPRPAPLDDTLIQPTLLGGLTAALPEGSTRMMSNTDQATVPLIDFDLSGADLPLTTRPGAAGALTGSQMASQMATKLDLARGYIDLGVKDGARELLEEVMRDGTREQRQAAVELMKQIER